MSDHVSLHDIADPRKQEKAWREAVEANRSDKPVAYKVTAAGYDNEGGRMFAEGETIVTRAAPGSWMEPIDKKEKAALDASQTFRGDPNFDAMSLTELRAYAATVRVASEGLSKADLVTAIKAVDDPTR